LTIFFPYLGRTTKVRVYKVYKVDIFKIQLAYEKKLKKRVVLPKPSKPKPKKELKKEPLKLPLPIIEEDKKEPEIILPQEKKEEPPAEEVLSQVEEKEEVTPIVDYSIKLLSYIEPEYPEPARRLGIEGKVVLKLLIDQEGKVEEVVEIVSEEPKGFGFKDAVMKVIYKYKFTKPKAKRVVYYLLPIRFTLEEQGYNP
jgi:protein TonB